MPASVWEETGREKKKNKGQEIKTRGKRYSVAGGAGGKERKKDGGGQKITEENE